MHDTLRTELAALKAEIVTRRADLQPRLEGQHNVVRAVKEGQDALRAAAQQQARAYDEDLAHAAALEADIDRLLASLATYEGDTERPRVQVQAEVRAQLVEKIATMQAALEDVEALPTDAVAGKLAITDVVPA